MNFSVYSALHSYITKYGAEGAFDRIKAAGYGAIEVLEGDPKNPKLVPDTATAGIWRNLLSDRGLSVSCYSAGVIFDLTDKSRAAHEDFVGTLKRLLDIAAALGSPYFHHTMVLHLEKPAGWPSFEEALPRLADAAEEVARYAAQYGIVCLYEPQGYYVNGHDRFPRFYNEMKRRVDNIGVCGDVGNILFAEGDPARFFCDYASEIPHAHIKDYKITDTPCNKDCLRTQGGHYVCEVPAGEGDIDLAACLAALARAGYDGAFSVESYLGEGRTDEAAAAVMQTVRAHFK